jgi:hypothetical protein
VPKPFYRTADWVFGVAESLNLTAESLYRTVAGFIGLVGPPNRTTGAFNCTAGAVNHMAPEMDEMPVIRVAIDVRILTHRRDEHPIGKRQVSNRERIKLAKAWSKVCHGESVRWRISGPCK